MLFDSNWNSKTKGECKTIDNTKPNSLAKKWNLKHSEATNVLMPFARCTSLFKWNLNRFWLVTYAYGVYYTYFGCRINSIAEQYAYILSAWKNVWFWKSLVMEYVLGWLAISCATYLYVCWIWCASTSNGAFFQFPIPVYLYWHSVLLCSAMWDKYDWRICEKLSTIVIKCQ